MPGTEKQWIKKLNRRPALKDVYSCGMANPYVSGIPDRYYEGKKRSLWVEYKHIKARTHLFRSDIRITGNQREWLSRCWHNGQQPHVIVGVGLSHGFILDDITDWDRVWLQGEHQKMHQSIDDIAIYIERFVNGTRK